jgi:methylated-DNA-[protein]-cysteine S-methyltransferase
MENRFYTLFETSLGRCGIAWSAAGVCAVSFPDDSDDKTRARLLKKAPGAEETETPPEHIARIVDDIVGLLGGDDRDLTYADLDMTGVDEFDRSVYALAIDIKPGETKSYGDLAKALGDVSLSRRVGQSLGRNPFPIIVPCHRIVGASGAMTGFSAPGGTVAKRKLLKIEGALAPDLFD